MLAASLRRATFTWLIVVAALLGVSVAHNYLAPKRLGLTDIFLYSQDLSVLGLSGLTLLALSRTQLWRLPLRAPAPSWRTVLLLALAVTAVGWAGSHLVYDDYALSMDEFMARFDAEILASGRLAAPVPVEWREYVKALQPLFMLEIPGHAYWVSNYLPVNAAFLALGLRLGVMNLVPALWAGISILATFAVGRRLWPEKPGAALVAAALLATSPQLLITAMTPYAMSAHLALNMVWLWLYLRGGRLGHSAAAGVALLATGLHQIAFHPLFAAPFVLELWLARRWKPALWHTCAYAVIGAIWALYQPLLVHLYGSGAVAQAPEGRGAMAILISLLAKFDVAGLGYIAKNLIRLVTWQSLLMTPLALMAIIPAVRAGGVMRALVLGAAATLLVVFVVMPYQGHGWGYRYLHGFLGSFSLLAALSWMRLGEVSRGETARRGVFACGLAVSVALLLPIRSLQAHGFEHPYSSAMRRIQASEADVAMVDDHSLWFGIDLVRNRPFLDNRPVVLAAASLKGDQMQRQCARRQVAWFSPDDLEKIGVPRANLPPRGKDLQAGCPTAWLHGGSQ